MRPRIFVRTLSEKEQQSLATGLRSSDAFVLRRSQMLLASARGETAPSIAKALSCDEQMIRLPSMPSTRRDFPLCKPDFVLRSRKMIRSAVSH